jgi:hypothetical protein
VPFVLFSGFDPHDDDLAKLVAELLDDGDIFVLDDGVLLTPSTDPDGRARQQHRARQRRYRDRKRDAQASPRDAQASPIGRSARDAGDAPESENSDAFGGVIQSLPTPFGGREGVTETPKRDASDASRVTVGDASRVTRDDASRWQLPPLTDEQREHGRERVRELGDALRDLRGHE